jgi:hypothetical protein
MSPCTPNTIIIKKRRKGKNKGGKRDFSTALLEGEPVGLEKQLAHVQDIFQSDDKDYSKSRPQIS